MEKVLPEDLERKFKSKQYLYDLLSIDLCYYLPPFEKCPISFLRQVLAGQKKTTKVFMFTQLAMKGNIVELMVPRFKELSVYKVWPLITEVNDLMQFFPDYKQNQLPERNYMYSILVTFRLNEVKAMIKNARDNRAIQNSSNDDRLVHIEKKLYEEIRGVMTHKCKIVRLLNNLVIKGRASYLLRRSAKLVTERRAAKEFELEFGDLHKDEEEKEDNEDIN